jgi:hypothetical protein
MQPRVLIAMRAVPSQAASLGLAVLQLGSTYLLMLATMTFEVAGGPPFHVHYFHTPWSLVEPPPHCHALLMFARLHNGSHA